MKRFVCFLLAMIMIIGMVPATAVTAFAASERTTSDKAINILKEYEGFAKYQYESGGKYYIGYGSQIEKDSYPDGISKDDALVLLKEHVEETVDKKVNEFTAKNNLTLTQYQHDALAMFTYNCGYAWMTESGNNFRAAVLQGKTGNEFINTMAQYYGADPSADNFKGLINRRLSEANMYLNNSYGFYAPGNFTYVILDMNGDEKVDAADEVIAYNSNIGMTLATVPTAGAENFLGWYVFDGKVDGKIEGQAVTTLDSNTAAKHLVAKFDNGADNETNFGNASYTINTSSLPSRYVFHETYSRTDLEKYKDSMDELAKGELKKNSNFVVDTEIMVDGVKWIRGVGKNTKNGTLEGWVYFGELPGEDSTTNTVLATATITTNGLVVREGATKDSDPTGKVLNKGVTVNIYAFAVEATNTGNKHWGKIVVDGVTGWINLAYADVKEIVDNSEPVEGKTGVIVNADVVNVRKDAGTTFGKITELAKGTKVTVLETKMNGAAQWGLVKWDGLKDGYTQGWVYMYYVEVDGLEHSNPTGGTGSNGAVLYTGVVTSNINLNVRQYPDVYAPRVGSLPFGTKVNIYGTTDSRNMKWGRIGTDQWVCLSYVNLTKVEGGNTGSTEGTASLQGTVTTTTLNILKSYNNNAEKIGTLKKGDVVTILEKNTETTETGSRIWGRILKDGVEGWINLAYVDLKNVTTVAPGTGTGSTGTTNNTVSPAVISDCLSVNVREAAGVYSKPITKLNNGTPVTVYEQITYANAPWARIKWNNGANEGWVCMYYVTLNSGSTGTAGTDNNGIVTGTNSNTISATGYVNNAYLNVRGGAGLGFGQVGTLNQGAKVTIFEQAVADGLIWGRINYGNGSGWVCMSYITVESASSSGKGVMGTIARCFAKANVRSAPGTNNALVGTVMVGSRVEVFEVKTHGAQKWGRIAQGWVCMDYVLLDSALPEGEILDATTAPTETTKETEPEVTINKDNEVAYVISGTVSVTDNVLNVRNDADSDSDKIGTIKNGESLTILAVKNNGTELWGRIDQYATAGWVNMQYVLYKVEGYINTDKQPVYADASTSSNVKGTLPLNTELKADKNTAIQKLTVNGETVYGWYQDTEVSGWIPMGRISKDPIKVIPTYQNTTDSVGANLPGKTNAAVTAYAATNSSEEVFYLTSGVTVYIGQINLEAGTIWGQVKVNGVEGWINLNAVTYTIPGKTAVADLNVRKTKDTSTDENILGVLETAGVGITICELSFDSNGALWGKLTGFTTDSVEAALNGGYVKMTSVTTTCIDIQTK